MISMTIIINILKIDFFRNFFYSSRWINNINNRYFKIIRWNILFSQISSIIDKDFLLSTMYLSVKFPVVPLLLSFAIYIIGAGTWIPYKRGLDDVGWFICYRHS